VSTITPQALPQAATLYLTQILVSYEDAIGLLRIRDTYDWHQRAWQAFGDRDDYPRNFLIRVDRKEAAFRLLILSHSPPTKPSWCPTDFFQSKAIPETYFSHTRYRFSLLTNPTKKVRVDNADGTRKKNGRRVPISTRRDLVAWIERKAANGGFIVDESALHTIPRGREFFHKDSTSHGTHTAIEFQGLLTVIDYEKFRAAIANGIGSAKAFGFGLLVLAPIS